jgi:hypothetical protein
MKKLILAAAALTSLTLMGATPASAGCTTMWVDGKLKQVCNTGVDVTLNNRGRRPAPRCQERRVPGTLRTVYVCG